MKDIEVGNFIYNQDENGKWVWKAKQSNKIPRLESKPKYKDAPRYNVIYEYEGKWKESYNKHLENLTKKLTKQMYKFIKL